MKKLHDVCHWGLLVLAVLCCAVLLVLNFLYCTNVFYDAAELVIWEDCPGRSLISLAEIAILLIFSALFLEKQLDKISARRLYWILSGIYLAAGVYLILNVEPEIRADAGFIHDAAIRLQGGDISKFYPGEYLYRYTHQLGILLLDSLILKISPNVQANFLLNLFLVLGINGLLTNIAHELFAGSRVDKWVLLLSFAFLPQLFFILFAYGLIPGMFFMILAMDLGLRFCRQQKVSTGILAAVSMGIACGLKSNFKIAAIALGIFLVMTWLREKKNGLILLALGMVLSMTLPFTALQMGYEMKTGQDLSQSAPPILWVAMGTDIHNDRRGPGWYNSFNWNAYNDANFDPDLAQLIGEAKLQANRQAIRENPGEAVRFFKDKTVSQWCDPMFESVWTGPRGDWGQMVYGKLMHSIFNGGKAERLIRHVMKGQVLLIFLFSLLFLLRSHGKVRGWEPFFLLLLGGFLFHMVWEAKSQYIYPYVYCLIPFGAKGFSDGAEVLREWLRKVRKN